MTKRSTTLFAVNSFCRKAVTSLLIVASISAPMTPCGGQQLAQAATLELQLGADFHPTHEQIEKLKKGFKRTTEDKVFYHWTSPEVGLRWAAQGYIDEGEVNFYNTPTGSRQAYGAGIYMASNAESSRNFGNFGVVFKMPAGTLVYTAELVQEVFGRALQSDEMTALGKMIPFIRDLDGDWHITHNPATLSHIEYGGPYGADAEIFRANNQQEMLAVIEKLKAYGDTGYLESFFHLMHYMDGIALQRAIRVAPSNPWSQFEPHLFENYRKLNDKILSAKPASTSVTTWAPSEPDREKWVDQQLKKTIPGLINGLFNSQGANFRGHSIRAGGTRDGQTFQATPQDLAELLANPYLNVTYRPDGTGYGFLVSYDYPNIWNLAKLKSVVSGDVFEELSKYSHDQLRADHALEVRLNQKLISDLLRNLLSDCHGQQIDPADFLKRYISIHPFSDGNGRSGRLFLQQNMSLAGASLPPFYISDLDLLVSKQTLESIIADSNDAYLKLQKAMIGEFLASGFGKKRAPDYFKLKQFQELTTSMSAFGFTSTDQIDRRFDHDIFERHFNEIFTQMKGPAWSLIPGENMPAALDLARKGGAKKYLQFIGEKAKKLVADLKPSEDLKRQNEVIKQFITYGKGLKELPSLKRAYAQKIKEIVRKLDYSKTEHFEILEQYKETADVNEQKETFSVITRGIRAREAKGQYGDWSVRDQQDRFRQAVQVSEMKYMMSSLINGSMSPVEFTGRLSKLDSHTPTLDDLEVTSASITLLLSKLDWKQRTQLLPRLNLASMPLDNTSVRILRKLVEPVSALPDSQAVEYRNQIADLLQYMFYQTNIQQPLGRLLYDLWLQAAPNKRYNLSSVRSFATDLIDARILDVLKEDLANSSKKTYSPEQFHALGGYIATLVYDSKRIPLDTKTLIDFYRQNPVEVSRVINYLNSVHFKTPIYYALLGLTQRPQDKLTLFQSLSGSYRGAAGAEQFRLELIKEAKHHLPKAELESLAVELLKTGTQTGATKLVKKTSDIAVQVLQAEFAKDVPNFATHYYLLRDNPAIWDRLTKDQKTQILADKELLTRFVGKEHVLKLNAEDYKLLLSAVQALSEPLRTQQLVNLRYGLLSTLSASVALLKPDTFSFLISEMQKLAPLTATDLLTITDGRIQSFDAKSKSFLISRVKAEYLKTAKLAVANDQTARNLMAQGSWASILTLVPFSESEKALITSAIGVSHPVYVASYVNSAFQNGAFLKSDYGQVIAKAIASQDEQVKVQMLQQLISNIAKQAVELKKNKSSSGTQVFRENLLYLTKSLSLNDEAKLRAQVEALHTSWSQYKDHAEILDYGRKELASAAFKREAYKLRYGKDYAGPRTCSEVFSSKLN